MIDNKKREILPGVSPGGYLLYITGLRLFEEP
jgi:hypothetical protein